MSANSGTSANLPATDAKPPEGPDARSRSRVATSSAGTIATTARPRRVTNTGTPSSASRIHSEKWAFASATDMDRVIAAPHRVIIVIIVIMVLIRNLQARQAARQPDRSSRSARVGSQRPDSVARNGSTGSALRISSSRPCRLSTIPVASFVGVELTGVPLRRLGSGDAPDHRMTSGGRRTARRSDGAPGAATVLRLERSPREGRWRVAPLPPPDGHTHYVGGGVMEPRSGVFAALTGGRLDEARDPPRPSRTPLAARRVSPACSRGRSARRGAGRRGRRWSGDIRRGAGTPRPGPSPSPR